MRKNVSLDEIIRHWHIQSWGNWQEGRAWRDKNQKSSRKRCGLFFCEGEKRNRCEYQICFWIWIEVLYESWKSIDDSTLASNSLKLSSQMFPIVGTTLCVHQAGLSRSGTRKTARSGTQSLVPEHTARQISISQQLFYDRMKTEGKKGRHKEIKWRCREDKIYCWTVKN